MTAKAQQTIYIKWVRSGIGFTYRQKEAIRGLGLRRLNQVVERVDTPQIRGLVASIPHLVEIVSRPPKAAWASVPEYTIRPKEVAPASSLVRGAEAPAEQVQEEAPVAPAAVPASSAAEQAAKGAENKRAEAAGKLAESSKERRK